MILQNADRDPTRGFGRLPDTKSLCEAIRRSHGAAVCSHGQIARAANCDGMDMGKFATEFCKEKEDCRCSDIKMMLY
jgi:hypothetical protein